jgi:hypothetical protein
LAGPNLAGLRGVDRDRLAHQSMASNHPNLAPLLAARPALAEALARIVVEHQRKDAARRAAAADRSAGAESAGGLAEQIAERTRRSFSSPRA